MFRVLLRFCRYIYTNVYNKRGMRLALLSYHFIS